MTRARTHRDDGRTPTRARWVDLGGRGKFKTRQLAGTEYVVAHCGHPTANYPWYGVRPDGSMITSGTNGELEMAFRYLDDAKVAVELNQAGNSGALALTAAHRRLDAAAPRPGLTQSRPACGELVARNHDVSVGEDH